MIMAETENKISQKDKKRLAKALFSYNPVNIDELQLKVNDVLEVIEETEEGWWKGTLNGNVGMFPSNFVMELNSNSISEELNELNPPTKMKNAEVQEIAGFKRDTTNSPSSKQEIKVTNVSSNAEDKTADSPKILDSSNRKESKKNTPDSTAPRLPPKPVREQARVIYPYTALNEDELSLKEGDIITILSKEVEDKGWWRGELNNRTGVFPDNFVQLIKVEEQKKPERPDKPSTALTSKASLKSSSSDFSPKPDKKPLKAPPVKPLPPEIHKKEVERPTPPFPGKKPQVPHPMKKPTRPSLGSKFSGFSPPSSSSGTKSDQTSSPPPAIPTEVKPEASSKNHEKKVDNKEEKRENQADLGLDVVESCGKKLVHLTANRARAPNRRPPSHIFLRETDKVNSISSSDPRRLSEPLLSEMKSVLNLGDLELKKAESNKDKVNASGDVKEVKISKVPQVPPSRPMPPSIRGNKPAIQGSIILTKTISSEECIVKAPEPIKKSVLPDVTSGISIVEVLHQSSKNTTTDSKISSDSKQQQQQSSTEKELQELKENLKALKGTMVGRSEFDELARQIKELRESLENCTNNSKAAIKELRLELESERKWRQTLEAELQQMKQQQQAT